VVFLVARKESQRPGKDLHQSWGQRHVAEDWGHSHSQPHVPHCTAWRHAAAYHSHVLSSLSYQRPMCEEVAILNKFWKDRIGGVDDGKNA
jgi:hypothetical protein